MDSALLTQKLEDVKRKMANLRREARTGIPHDIEERSELIEKSFEFADKSLSGKYKIVVFDWRNCDLTCQLLNCDKNLLNENQLGQTITRFVYSERFYTTKYKLSSQSIFNFSGLQDEIVAPRFRLPKIDCYEEILIHQPQFEPEILEIGLASNFLKNGVELIDCPRFDVSTLSSISLAILSNLNPSLILYVYEGSGGLQVKEAELIETLYLCVRDINENQGHLLSYILIEKEFASSAENQYEVKFPTDDERSNKLYDIHKLEKFDNILRVDKTLPRDTFPRFQTFTFIRWKSAEEFLPELCKEIASTIDNLYFALVDIVARQFKMHRDEMDLDEEWLQFWFRLKSKSMDQTVLRRFKQENPELLLQFKNQFRIYQLDYLGKPMQVTQMFQLADNKENFSLEMQRIYKNQRSYYSSGSPFIYYDEEESSILIFEKNMSQERLVDYSTSKSLSDILCLIDKLAYQCLIKFTDQNFRPDTTFIDSYGNLIINNNVPNSSSLQFVGVDKKLVPAFHIKPQYDNYYFDSDHLYIQTYYTIAWCIWILLEGKGSIPPIGSGEEVWLKMLDDGKFPEYPEYLKHCLVYCWNIESLMKEENPYPLKQFLQSNFWLQDQSVENKDSFHQLQQNFDFQNPFLEFNSEFKIYRQEFEGEMRFITYLFDKNSRLYRKQKKVNGERIVNFSKDEYSFDLEKVRVRYDNIRLSSSTKLFLTEDESTLFIAHVEYSADHCKRLLDCLHEFSIETLEAALIQFINQHEHISFNLRPDNVYINVRENKIFYLECIPNRPDIPLVMKNGKNVKPFHIHPESLTTNELNQIKSERLLRYSQRDQNVYGFGWLVWMIVEGSGESEPGMWLASHTDWVANWLSVNECSDNLRFIMTKCLLDTRQNFGHIWRKLRSRFSSK